VTSQPSQPKEKRGIASERRRRQLLLLVAALQWELTGLLVEELIEETGLTDRTVRSVLDELLIMDPPLVAFRERPRRDGERGKQPKVFSLA
jgi:hypothetical protein